MSISQSLAYRHELKAEPTEPALLLVSRQGLREKIKDEDLSLTPLFSPYFFCLGGWMGGWVGLGWEGGWVGLGCAGGPSLYVQVGFEAIYR